LARIAVHVVFVRQKPNFQNFCQGAKEAHAYQLLAMLDPLMFYRGRDVPAHNSLIELIGDAQQIGLDMYSCPFDARLHFPEVGEAYDPTCMVVLETRSGITQVNDAKVKMSVTPSVRLGLNQTDPARVRNVSSAQVFTSLPGEEEEPMSLTPGRFF
jgi:hypothetical protein